MVGGLVQEQQIGVGDDQSSQGCARLLASGPPLVFAAIKETARVAEGRPFQEALDLVTSSTLPTVAALYSSEDGLEGFRAFAEKRPPVWKGR